MQPTAIRRWAGSGRPWHRQTSALRCHGHSRPGLLVQPIAYRFSVVKAHHLILLAFHPVQSGMHATRDASMRKSCGAGEPSVPDVTELVSMNETVTELCSLP